jgi:D-sedoheptulose 7-phosphate isomerase
VIKAKKAGGTDPCRFDFSRFVSDEFREHRLVLDAMEIGITAALFQAAQIIETSILSGGKILLFGNGGSAADAQHIAAELVIRYKEDRAPIAAIALTTDTSSLTACGNDFGFEHIFARQVDALALPNDVVIGISTSGNSPNVIAGIVTGRKRGAKTIGLSSAAGGNLAGICDALICVPSNVTARIQEMHILIGHMLCKSLEIRLGLL